MPDAFTWTNGAEMRTFKTRAEMYDYMIERGDIILEGDDAAKFDAHCQRSKHPNAANAAAKVVSLRGF